MKYNIDAATYDEAALKETFGDLFDEAKYAELKDDEGFVSRAALEALSVKAAVGSAHDNVDSIAAATPAEADAATGSNAAAADQAAAAVQMKEVAAGGGGLTEDGKTVEDTGVGPGARGAGGSGAGAGEEVKAGGEAKAEEIKLKKSMSLGGAGLTLVAVAAEDDAFDDDRDPDKPLYTPTARGLRKSFLCTMQKDLLKAHSTGDMLADAVREVQKREIHG